MTHASNHGLDGPDRTRQLQVLWVALARPTGRAHLVFWLVVLAVGLPLRYALFRDMRRADVLAQNTMRGADMERFLNWSRILEGQGRWLSDFDVLSTVDEPPVTHAVFHQTPLYPYVLAIAAAGMNLDLDYPRGGHEEFLYLLIAQQLCGLILLWPLHEILRRLCDVRVARVGTFVFLFSQVGALYEMYLLRVTLLSLLYILVVHNLFILRERQTLGRAFLTGIWVGLAWMAKATFVVVVPAIVLHLVLFRDRSKALRQHALRWAMLLVGTALVLLPAVTRNLRLDVAPLRLTTRGTRSYINGNSFASYWAGTSLNDPGGPMGIGWRWSEGEGRLYGRYAEWTKDQRSLGSVIRTVWREHTEEKSWLDRFVPMAFLKLHAFFNGYEHPNNVNLYWAREAAPTLNLFFIGPFPICLFFVFGAVRCLGRWRDARVSLLLGFILLHVLHTTAFYFIGRFRAPVIPLMYVVAVLGVRETARAWRSHPAILKVGALILFGVCLWVSWPRDVRGGLHQEVYEAYGGINLTDYRNAATLKISVSKWRDALAICQTGLSQKDGARDSRLWALMFRCLISCPEMREERWSACRTYVTWARSKLGAPRFDRARSEAATLRTMILYYAYSLDQLYLEARQKNLVGEQRRIAREAIWLRKATAETGITQYREKHGFTPIVEYAGD